MRAAANSSASGSPSSRAQIVATAAALLGVSRNSGLHRLRPLQEEPDGRVPREVAALRQMPQVRHGQRRHRALVLAGDAEGRPARHQDRERGAGAEEIGDQGGRRQQVLEVVEDEQETLRTEVGDQPLAERPLAGIRQVERLGDRRGDQAGVAERGQPDEPDPVREAAAQVAGHLEREAGLPHAAGSGERDEANVRPAQQIGDGRDVGGAADERGERRRQIRRRAALHRWRAARGPRPPAAAANAARSSPSGCNASTRSATVSLRGVRLTPRSRSLMPRTLSPARSASASWVRPAAMRSAPQHVAEGGSRPGRHRSCPCPRGLPSRVSAGHCNPHGNGPGVRDRWAKTWVVMWVTPVLRPGGSADCGSGWHPRLRRPKQREEITDGDRNPAHRRPIQGPGPPGVVRSGHHRGLAPVVPQDARAIPGRDGVARAGRFVGTGDARARSGERQRRPGPRARRGGRADRPGDGDRRLDRDAGAGGGQRSRPGADQPHLPSGRRAGAAVPRRALRPRHLQARRDVLCGMWARPARNPAGAQAGGEGRAAGLGTAGAKPVHPDGARPDPAASAPARRRRPAHHSRSASPRRAHWPPNSTAPASGRCRKPRT